MDTILTAIFAGLVALLAAGVPAFIAIKKMRLEYAEKVAALEKIARNGVIGEWREMVERHSKEIVELRGEIMALRTENANLRSLILAKEVLGEKQAGQVEQLQTAVTLMKDAVPVLKVPEGSTVEIPPKEK